MSSVLLPAVGEWILLSSLDTAAGRCFCHSLTFPQCCCAATIPGLPCCPAFVSTGSFQCWNSSVWTVWPASVHPCPTSMVFSPQPPCPPGLHPSLRLFPRSPPPNQLEFHRLSSISFWHCHFSVPTINCSPCRLWWHKVIFYCCSSPHLSQPGLHVGWHSWCALPFSTAVSPKCHPSGKSIQRTAGQPVYTIPSVEEEWLHTPGQAGAELLESSLAEKSLGSRRKWNWWWSRERWQQLGLLENEHCQQHEEGEWILPLCPALWDCLSPSLGQVLEPQYKKDLDLLKHV